MVVEPGSQTALETLPVHGLSPEDRQFCDAFEAGACSPAAFNHRAHIRLAYIYLAEGGVAAALPRMRQALLTFLSKTGVPASKYHETLTQAWIYAVHHFMQPHIDTSSAEDFIDKNPRLLDTKILLTHYTADVLFSPGARTEYLQPDLDPIPRYGAERDGRTPPAGEDQGKRHE